MFQKPIPLPEPLRRIVNGTLLAITYCAGVLWFLAFGYADWLRFTSPTSPDPATGQIIYEKAVKGVFFVTDHQSWLVDRSLPFIWGAGAIAILAYLTVNGTAQGLRESKAAKILGYVWVIFVIAMMLFGDQIFSLIFTGSFTPPSTTR